MAAFETALTDAEVASVFAIFAPKQQSYTVNVIAPGVYDPATRSAPRVVSRTATVNGIPLPIKISDESNEAVRVLEERYNPIKILFRGADLRALEPLTIEIEIVNATTSEQLYPQAISRVPEVDPNLYIVWAEKIRRTS